MRNNETSRGSQSPKSAPLKGKKAADRKDDTIRDDEEDTEDKGRFASDETDEDEDDLELADADDELSAADDEDEEDEDAEFEKEDELDIEDEDSGSRLRDSDDLN